ncbi:MAG: hypothetical protein E7370_04225 [Clostridiales bacterium]|nr:hypothetical protein [Clostridiales bacterium]
MSKKLFLTFIISLIFVLCTSIGLGAWIIVNQVTLSPNYSSESVRKIITPKIIELDYTTEDDGNENKLPIKWDAFKTAISTSAKVICETSTGTEVTLTAGTDITLNISAMNNGDIYYGTAVSGLTAGHTYVVGSTYTATAEVASLASGYKLSSASTSVNILIKYKTAKIGFNSSTYYTVEDAIAKASSSDTITFDGVAVLESYTVTSGSNTTTHYKSIYSDTCRTSFTNLSSSVTGYSNDNYNLKGKLRVPFANVDMDYHGSGGVTSIGGSSKGCDQTFVQAISTRDPTTAVYSVLVIPDNVTLNVATTGNFIVGGLVQAQGAVTNRGVVMNEGTINVNGNLGSYGYLKGNGTVNFNSDAKGIDVFRIYDWNGGARAAGLKTANVFPINAYSAHNISCETVINVGSSYEAFWTIAFNNSLYKGYQRGDKDDNGNKKDGNIKLIGKAGTSALFELTSGSIIKSANGGRGSTATSLNNALLNLTGSNATKGQMDVYTINGICSDNTISISIKATGQSVTMETNTDIALPVGFMDVVVSQNGTLNINSASYKFLPGSSLTVNNGGVLNVSNSAALAFCDVAYATQDATKFINQSVNDVDAFATINGTVNVASGSSIGGKLLTVGNTGNLKISGASSASLLMVTSIEEGLLTDTANVTAYTMNSTGNVYNYDGNAANATLSSANHIAKNSAWIAPNSRLAITYIFNDIDDPTKIIESNDYFTIDSSPLFSAKIPDGYKLVSYYWDENYTEIIDTNIKGSELYEKWDYNEASITLYAKVKELNANQTTIKINIDTTNKNNSDNISYNSSDIYIDKSVETYDLSEINNTLSANNINCNKKSYFDGWYYDSNYTERVTDITQIDLSKANANNTLNLYARWIDKHTITITVTNGADGSGIGGKSGVKPNIELTIENNSKITIKENSNNRQTYYIAPGQQFTIANTDTGTTTYGGTTTTGTHTAPNLPYTSPTNYTFTATGAKGSDGACIVEGTLITLADGSQKKVEDLTTTDELLVFNHETGEYEVGYMWFNDTEEAAEYRIINLEFSDGTVVKVVYKHGFFDLTLNKYVAITENNVNEFVGHRFYTSTWNGEEFIEGEITLTRAYVTTEYVKVYSPITIYHFNYFTENLLSMPSMNFDMDEVLNTFEYDKDLKYDEEKMQADIEKYGLFTYEELQDYIPYEVYELTPIKYWKIAIGKGLITFEDIINTAELLKDKGFM